MLHAAGWITQIPAQLSVAVMSRRNYVSLHGFEIRGRPRSWFRKVHEAVLRASRLLGVELQEGVRDACRGRG